MRKNSSKAPDFLKQKMNRNEWKVHVKTQWMSELNSAYIFILRINSKRTAVQIRQQNSIAFFSAFFKLRIGFSGFHYIGSNLNCHQYKNGSASKNCCTHFECCPHMELLGCCSMNTRSISCQSSIIYSTWGWREKTKEHWKIRCIRSELGKCIPCTVHWNCMCGKLSYWLQQESVVSLQQQ